MGVFSMLLLALLVTALTGLIFVVIGALSLFIFKLMIKGATKVPSVIFALFLGARFENIFFNIIGFVVAFLLTQKLMQYSRVRNAIIIFVAMVASALAFGMPHSTLVNMLGYNIPSFIWLFLCFVLAGIVSIFVFVSNEVKWNENHIMLERVVSSFLYMLGLYFAVTMFALKGMGATASAIVEIALLVVAFIGTYIADVKLTKDWVHIKQQLLQYPTVRTITVFAKKIISDTRAGV